VNASLKEFSLHSTHIMTKYGLDAIFAALKRSTCTLEMFSVCMNLRMEDDVLSSISNALLENCTLKSLCLDGYGIYAPSDSCQQGGSISTVTQSCLCVGNT
jgi:hypothetical protein